MFDIPREYDYLDCGRSKNAWLGKELFGKGYSSDIKDDSPLTISVIVKDWLVTFAVQISTFYFVNVKRWNIMSEFKKPEKSYKFFKYADPELGKEIVISRFAAHTMNPMGRMLFEYTYEATVNTEIHP
ncbi:LOW QUALITY PROTEIN: fatty acid synthase-like [Vespula maculifrons]|uniref:Fatty acid synthase-like n=1 Tax=Vespula maculifrons TaxID=7453 RepID=A0ABD2B9A4_VESMC